MAPKAQGKDVDLEIINLVHLHWDGPTFRPLDRRTCRWHKPRRSSVDAASKQSQLAAAWTATFAQLITVPRRLAVAFMAYAAHR